MSAETRQALEDAISAHLLDENEDKTVMLSEYLLITAAQYMNPERPYTTGYGWACTQNMSHSHLLGLIGIGTEIIRDSLSEES